MKKFFLFPMLLLGIHSSMSACAQWPQKPVRIVVAAPAGSSVDIVARLIAQELRPRLGQAIIVDNKPAAGGTLAAAEVAKSAADGYRSGCANLHSTLSESAGHDAGH